MVAAIVDRDTARAEALAVDVGSVQAGAKVADDLADGRKYRSRAEEVRGTPCPHFAELGDAALALCDLVYIGTTPDSHRPLALLAYAAGKHVLLEKPLAASAADADAIVTAAEAALADRGCVTGMNIGMRWNGALIALRSAIEAGELGALRSASLRLGFIEWPRVWQKVDWCARRAQGGALREVGTHFLFGINDLWGHGCVEAVRCEVEYADGADGALAETAADGAMRLRGGLEVAVSLELGLERDAYELEVRGDRGGLLMYDFRKLRALDGDEPFSSAAADAYAELAGGGYGRKDCIKSLIRAADGLEAPDLITPRQGRNAQRVLDALLASRGAWVDVAYD